jgi:dolichol kinase
MKERFRRELIRKTFHLTAISVPLFYVVFGRDIVILYTAASLLFFVILEFIRVRAHSIFPLSKTADLIQRQGEKNSIAASIYFCVAALGTLFFLDERAVVVGLSAALIGDAAAALVGTGIGKHNIKSGKTVEGTLAGILVASLVAYLLNSNLATIFAVGIVFLVFDLVDFRFDDNFTLPLATAIVVQVLEALL